MKFTLLRNPQGYALYEGEALVATWDKRDTYDYVLSQVAKKTDPEDEVVEKAHEGVFPEKLVSKSPVAPKEGVKRPQTKAKEEKQG